MPAANGSLPRHPEPLEYRPLQRLLLTDEVSRTLFEEYGGHRASERGDEETGWVLLGLRTAEEAIVLATLPAGANREAGQAHVRFNSSGQALASRIIRQHDRRLTLLGVVHTHPGRLRHPSDGDYQGDRLWVQQLRGREGIFGIGTADAEPPPDATWSVSWQPRPHVQCLGDLRLTWYSLADGDHRYRPIPVELTIGPDWARDLRPVWPMIEDHAERLDRLARQLIGVRFEIVGDSEEAALTAIIALPEAGRELRVIMEGKTVRYVVVRDGEWLQADLREAHIDQGVYLILAELAGGNVAGG